MTIKALYPTSEPTLNLDFANTKRLDPRITFSRASAGTYFDENGTLRSAATNAARFDHNPATGESLGLLVEEARTNLANYSDNLTGWVNDGVIITPNRILDPSGTINGTLITGVSGNRRTYKLVVIASGSAYTYSVFVKKNIGSTIGMDNINIGSSNTTFNFDTGVLTLQGSAFSSGTATAYPNGWYKLTLTYTSNTTTSALGLYTINTNDSFYAWGYQHELGAFATSYIPTPATFTGRTSTATFYNASGVVQTAASGVARSDAYLPDSNGVIRPLGLLLEAAATNQHLQSGNLSGYAFTASGVGDAITNLYGTSADGVASKTLRVQTGSAARVVRWVSADCGIDAISTQYIVSFFYRGTIPSSTAGRGGSAVAPTIIYPPVGGLMGRAQASITSGTNGTAFLDFTYNATSDGELWGVQVEKNSSFPTSYIPTVASTVTRSADTSTSATVTRSADVASITGTNFSSWYNQNEGTMLATYSPQRITSTTCWAVFVGGTTTIGPNVFVIGKAGLPTRAYAETRINSITQYVGIFDVATGPMRTAYGFKNGDHRAAFNGTLVAAGSGTFAPLSSDNMYIGRNLVTTDLLNGTLSRVTYWPTRLSDTQLQAVTAT